MLVTSFTGHRKHRYLLRSFGLRRAAGVLCSGARSRSYRDARAWPPAEVAPKPCLCPPFRTVYLFACTPYRVPIIALSLFRRASIGFAASQESQHAVLNSTSAMCERAARVSHIGWHQLSYSYHVRWKQYGIRAQCKRRGRVEHTRTSMEDRRCATCEALGRRSLSSKLLQAATAQAHMKTCAQSRAILGDVGLDRIPDSDLASRALAAKRRKSIASIKLSLQPDASQKPSTTERARSNCTRRNTWCS